MRLLAGQRGGINTPLARRLARIYTELVGPFLGGKKNACIERLYPGHWQRAQGAWSWMLLTIDGSHVLDFGSGRPAREAAGDPQKIECVDPLRPGSYPSRHL